MASMVGIAFLVLIILIAIAGVVAWKKFNIGEMWTTMASGMNSPAAIALKEAGCAQAAVFDFSEIFESMKELLSEHIPEDAAEEANIMVVYCAQPSAVQFSCEAAARIYLAHRQEVMPFMVVVQGAEENSCEENYDAAGVLQSEIVDESSGEV